MIYNNLETLTRTAPVFFAVLMGVSVFVGDDVFPFFRTTGDSDFRDIAVSINVILEIVSKRIALLGVFHHVGQVCGAVACEAEDHDVFATLEVRNPSENVDVQIVRALARVSEFIRFREWPVFIFVSYLYQITFYQVAVLE